MLDYEWGNPSTILLAGNEGAGATESDQTHRQIFDHNYTFLHDPFVHGSTLTTTTGFSHHHSFNSPQPQQQHPFFDPRAFPGASATSFSPTPSVLSLNPIPPVTPSHCELGPGSGLGLVLMPKSEDVTPAMNFGASGLGLNLGGRTYFASCNDDMVSRLYRRSKMVESVSVSSNFPRCQAEGCNADLSDAKHYHRRHKVCEYHSKAATVIAAGLTQRFCQQCSRFHLLSEFDNGKRSCRKRLADHNRRRRKIQQPTQEIQKSHPTFDNVATGSSPDSSSLVKVAMSPPDYFQERPCRNRDSSTS
ncbi:hypothetical protein VNO77_19955 [Canavalia gladiata]|uniref:SBP-type domain-containing protein n=1 Tax=Canavalia gladiata TaxID=3824 RepID=A0AAN9LNK4_CANGL